jgi:hypothetical protein
MTAAAGDASVGQRLGHLYAPAGGPGLVHLPLLPCYLRFLDIVDTPLVKKERNSGLRGRRDQSNARGDAVQNVFKVDEVLSGRFVHPIRVAEGEPLRPAAAFRAFLAPEVVDEAAAHGLGRRGEEMAAAVPGLRLLDIDQPDVGFMDQSRRLQGLTDFTRAIRQERSSS